MKYNNKKETVDGLFFHSGKEASHYRYLRTLERAGEITDLEMQKTFELLPKQDGERAVKYIADFCYKNSEGVAVVEDVKGFKTKDYILKRKMMLYFHNVKIIEV